MTILGPSLERVVFIAKHSTSSACNIATFLRVCVVENEITLHPSFRVEQLSSQRVRSRGKMHPNRSPAINQKQLGKGRGARRACSGRMRINGGARQIPLRSKLD